MPQIDQTKEVEAAAKRVELEVSTLEDETLQLTGKQWSDVHRQRVKERAMQKADGTLPEPAPARGAASPADHPPPNPPPENQGDLEQAEAL